MKMLLTRDVKTPTFTLGGLQIGQHNFVTCEDTIREIPGVPVEQWKIPGKTAISFGTYRVIIDYSQRFKKDLPLLIDVPGFDGVRIHSLNNAEQSEGCIGVGLTRDEKIGWIYQSRAAMEMLQSMIAHEIDMNNDVWITIK